MSTHAIGDYKQAPSLVDGIRVLVHRPDTADVRSSCSPNGKLSAHSLRIPASGTRPGSDEPVSPSSFGNLSSGWSHPINLNMNGLSLHVVTGLRKIRARPRSAVARRGEEP